MICSTTYILQSIITNHLNLCSEHQIVVRDKHKLMAAKRKEEYESSFGSSRTTIGVGVGVGFDGTPTRNPVHSPFQQSTSQSQPISQSQSTSTFNMEQSPKQLLYDLVITPTTGTGTGDTVGASRIPGEYSGTGTGGVPTPVPCDNDTSFSSSIYDSSFSYGSSGPNTMKRLTNERHRNIINHLQYENNWYISLLCCGRNVED